MEDRYEKKKAKVTSLNERIDELKQELQDADAEVLRAQTQMLNNATPTNDVIDVDQSILDQTQE
jgi:chromosome segregation ATPase